MSHPSWRSKFQTDAQNVTYTTRLISIVSQRTLLHAWLTIKAIWRFGILRSILVLPLWFCRLLFFPLLWPLSVLGGAITSACRWVTDTALTSIGRGLRAAVVFPVKAVSNVFGDCWRFVGERVDRCRRQWQELRELGFVNSVALMPFLIVRLVQGAVLTFCEVVAAIAHWIWRGITATAFGIWSGVAAAASWIWNGIGWIVGLVSIAGCWRWMKQSGGEVGSRLAASPIARGMSNAPAAAARMGRSLSRPRWPAWATWNRWRAWDGWNAWGGMSRSLRQHTAWLLVTVTGTLGLLLLLYLQWSSPRPVAGARESSILPLASTTSPVRDNQSFSAAPPQSEPQIDDWPPAQAEAPLAEEQSEPPLDDFGAEPFSPRPKANVPEPEKPPADSFARTSPIRDDPDPFAPEPAPRKEVEEPLDNPPLALTLGWVKPVDSFDRQPGNEFAVSAPPAIAIPRAPLGDSHDGWQKPESPAVVARPGRPAGRLQLNVPDLVVPAAQVESPLTSTNVQTPTVPYEPTPPVEPQELETPELALDVSTPFQIAAGNDCVVQFKVTNTSSERYDRVILRASLADGLTHRRGSRLDYRIDSLAPGETRLAQLTTRAHQAGRGAVLAQLRIGEETLQRAEKTVQIIGKLAAAPACPCPCPR